MCCWRVNPTKPLTTLWVDLPTRQTSVPFDAMPKVHQVDPEAEKFLEGNVIKDFFVAIYSTNIVKQSKPNQIIFLLSKMAIIKAQEALPAAIAEIEKEANNLTTLEKEKQRLTSDIEERNCCETSTLDNSLP